MGKDRSEPGVVIHDKRSEEPGVVIRNWQGSRSSLIWVIASHDQKLAEFWWSQKICRAIWEVTNYSILTPHPATNEQNSRNNFTHELSLLLVNKLHKLSLLLVNKLHELSLLLVNSHYSRTTYLFKTPLTLHEWANLEEELFFLWNSL